MIISGSVCPVNNRLLGGTSLSLLPPSLPPSRPLSLSLQVVGKAKQKRQTWLGTLLGSGVGVAHPKETQSFFLSFVTFVLSFFLSFLVLMPSILHQANCIQQKGIPCTILRQKQTDSCHRNLICYSCHACVNHHRHDIARSINLNQPEHKRSLHWILR